MKIRSPWFRLALRETRNNRRFSILFCVNMALGLIGFLTLDAFKSSIQSDLEARSKSILAADLSVSTTRDFTPEELSKFGAMMPQGSVQTREINLMSMVSTGSASRLVEVRAIDRLFPLYGQLTLEKAGLVNSTTSKDIHAAGNVWVYPELLVQLGAKIGDLLTLGASTYTISDVVLADSSSSSVSFSIAPRIFVSVATVDQTGLITLGSRVTRALLFKFPDETFDVVSLEGKIKESLSGRSEIRVRSHKSASEELGRLLRGLNDYLGLVALVALFLASVGATYLFRSFMIKRAREIAILLSIGATYREARRVYVYQLLLLGLMTAVCTLAMTGALLPVVPTILAPLLAGTVPIGLNLRSVAVALVMGTGGSLLFCLPLLTRFKTLQPAALFQETIQPKIDLSLSAALAYLPGLAIYWGLAIWQAKSLRVGSLFVGSFLAAGLILTAVGLLLLKIASRLKPLPEWHQRLAILNLTRDRLSAVSCFLAISLGALLVNVVPQIRRTIESQLVQPQGSALPSLFLFDIQDEQVGALQEFLRKEQASLAYLSPMVRARLEMIKGEPADGERTHLPGTRERENEENFRARMYNLSSRAEFAESERIVAGRPFSGSYHWDSGTPAEMSLEVRFAERMGVTLDDTLQFDIQGVSVVGRVVSLRQVRWTSFQPNFFVQFPPGVLDDAPKTFVAAIPESSLSDRIALQTAIVRQFPNISIVDVKNSVQRILVIVGQMTAAITLMAYLSLVAGFAVLYSIANHQAQKRRGETALLKVFGARFRDIQKVTFLEFGALGFFASILGGTVSLVVSYILARFVFDGGWSPAWGIPSASALAITSLCLGTGWLATRKSLATKPADLLGNSLGD